MKAVYAVKCSVKDNPVLYASLEAARVALAQIAQERRHRLGVCVVEDTVDVFRYLMGWEEAEVSFRVAEIEVHEFPSAGTWIDEPIFVGGAPNPKVPFHRDVRSLRVESMLDNLCNGYKPPSFPVVRSTRDLIKIPHALFLDKVKNAGKKSIADLAKALASHGVAWPVKGEK